MSSGAAAILVAGGSGERLAADCPKAFVELAGVTLFEHCLRVLCSSAHVTRVIAVVPQGWEDTAQQIARAGQLDATIVIGGSTRAASVLNGLQEIDGREQVFVHDAARPGVTLQMLERLSAAWDASVRAVIPALPLADTIKLVDGDQVSRTLDRSALRAAQTPQLVHARTLLDGLLGAPSLAAITDCAQVIERAGHAVRWIEGDERLAKVTVPADLLRMEQEAIRV